VTYWVSHSSSQGVFPRWTLSKSCEEDEVDGVRLLGMGFMTYKGLYCLIYGCLCRGCVAPSFSMHPFSKPIYLPLIYLSPEQLGTPNG
jgi:hypothetical protein